MGNPKKTNSKSRRSFLSFLFTGKDELAAPQNSDTPEKVKMLTADGKLVEVDKNVLEQALKNRKANNKEILNWMKNPSKENS